MDIMNEIYEIIKDIDGLEGIDIKENDLLEENIDSLSFIIILMKVEEKFNIEINEEDLSYETFKTLKDIRDYVERIK